MQKIFMSCQLPKHLLSHKGDILMYKLKLLSKLFSVRSDGAPVTIRTNQHYYKCFLLYLTFC